MREVIKKTRKTRIAVISVLTFITLLIPCWQFYKSASQQDLSGAWKLKFVNESSSKKSFIGEIHTQKVFFTQTENSIVGNGEKWEYNGRLLPFDQHRKIEYIGAVHDDIMKATFKLYGLLRESSGSVDLRLIDNGRKLSGRFIGTAGDTRGTVTGERID